MRRTEGFDEKDAQGDQGRRMEIVLLKRDVAATTKSDRCVTRSGAVELRDLKKGEECGGGGKKI